MKYIAILRGRSACRIPENCVLSLGQPNGWNSLTVNLFTRYTNEGFESSVPRELCAELIGDSNDNFADAQQSMESTANSFSAQLAVATNAPIRYLETCCAYDASPGVTRHPILCLMWPLEHGLPHAGRPVPVNEAIQLMKALTDSPDSARIGRACTLYNESLLRLRPGHEVDRMMFLWMAVEALTKTALHMECRKRGTDDTGLVLLWGLVAEGASPDELTAGKRRLDGEVRRRLIFHGDSETMKSLKRASDGMEHSFLEPRDVHKMSVTAVSRGSEHIRLAIFELLQLSNDTIRVLTSWPYATPKCDIDGVGYYEGEMIGPAENLKSAKSNHPELDVRLSLDGCKLRNDGLYDIRMRTDVSFSSGAGIVVEGRSGAWMATPDGTE